MGIVTALELRLSPHAPRTETVHLFAFGLVAPFGDGASRSSSPRRLAAASLLGVRTRQHTLGPLPYTAHIPLIFVAALELRLSRHAPLTSNGLISTMDKTSGITAVNVMGLVLVLITLLPSPSAQLAIRKSEDAFFAEPDVQFLVGWCRLTPGLTALGCSA